MRFGIREIVFLLVLLAVPVASFLFVFSPQNEEIEQAKKEIAHKESMLESLSKATARTATLAQTNDEIEDAIRVIESRLPSDKEVDKILEQVAEIALSNNLELKQVKSKDPVPAAAYMEQPLDMVISGRFENFYAFMLDLEKLDRITRTLDMRIKRSTKADGEIEASFTLSIYFESENSEGAGS